MMSPRWISYKAALRIPILLPFFSSAFGNLTTKKIDWAQLSVLELLKWILMFMFCLGLWVIRLIAVYLPDSVPASGLLEAFSQSSSLISKCENETAHSFEPRYSDNAIFRALSQVLALLNDIPVSSEKHEFVRTLADKIIQQNISQENVTFMEVNRYALAGGFARTSKLLAISMERLQQQEEFGAYIWPWKLIRPLFLRGLAIFPQMLSLHSLRMRLIHMLYPGTHPESLLADLSPSKVTAGTQVQTDCVMAEKFAQELLWISQKLKQCSAIEEAIMQWSSASSLARLSLSAYPRVQSSLLRICVLMVREFFSEEVKENKEIQLKFLLLWLPLFCCAKNGHDTPPILSNTEKTEVVSILEVIILSLPCSDQEMLLASWLHEYSLSSSDWPNLQHCYERWCQASLKSALQSGWISDSASK